MFKKIHLCIAAIATMAYYTAAQGQPVNDHIFPASVSAKLHIDFDKKGFIIEGKRTFLASAGLEYARIPHELWRDRLLRIKRAGFNCIEIYTIWNFHEPKEGKFDFAGDHDLNAFLKLVNELGLYAIVRVGPYYCAEWDNGGYPIWLKFKKGLRVREHSEAFEKYVDRFFDKLLPIVFNNQINKGGSVILVQLENEHPKGWGTDMPDGYFTHLQSKALAMGMQVPYFFSGLHHASDPAGESKLDDAARPNPWFSTEFWSVWYSQYGAMPKDAPVYDRRTWKIIARGGNGYNYYMVHGGSNFGYTNNDEDAASYDYGAAIGQTGDLRPTYYTFKRANWFGRSFREILENSEADSITYAKIAGDSTLKITTRKSVAGDLIFLDNPGDKTVSTSINIPGNQWFAGNSRITVRAGEIVPLVHRFKINESTTLDWALTRVFAVTKQGNTTTIIAEAEKGLPLALYFSSTAGLSTNSPAVKVEGGHVTINETMPAIEKPLEYIFKSGAETVRVLAMNREWSDRTFIENVNNQNYIISGADYLGKAVMAGKQFTAQIEYPLNAIGTKSVWLFTGTKSYQLKQGQLPNTLQPAIIPLKEWQYKSGANFTAKNFNTSQWLSSNDPLPMGADGDVSPDAAYRTTLKIPDAGKYTIQLKGNGRGQAFIDGRPAANWKMNSGELTLDLQKGNHILAIFAAHDGRDKLAGYLGPIDKVDSKGLFGKALIKKGGPFISELHDWYFAKAQTKEDVKQGPPIFNTSLYKPYKIGNDVFGTKEGFAWFTTVIPQQAPGTSAINLQFKSVDENATVFINGKQVFHHDGWNQPFEVDITDGAVLKAPITLSIFIENYSNEGGIDQPVKINTIGQAQPLSNWKMKGGPGDVLAVAGWQPSIPAKVVGPACYLSSFSLPTVQGTRFIWRVEPKGLGHGSVWINGHNLGRYPEKIKISSLYIPECWLKKGINQLVIYDEDGNKPLKATIVAEPAAGVKEIQISSVI